MNDMVTNYGNFLSGLYWRGLLPKSFSVASAAYQLNNMVLPLSQKAQLGAEAEKELCARFIPASISAENV